MNRIDARRLAIAHRRPPATLSQKARVGDPDRFEGRDTRERKQDRPGQTKTRIDPFAAESPREEELERGKEPDRCDHTCDRVECQQRDGKQVIPGGPEVPVISNKGSACGPLLPHCDAIGAIDIARKVCLDWRQQIGRNVCEKDHAAGKQRDQEDERRKGAGHAFRKRPSCSFGSRPCSPDEAVIRDESRHSKRRHRKKRPVIVPHMIHIVITT